MIRTRYPIFPGFGSIVLAALWVAAPVRALAEPAIASQESPPAEELIARYVDAIGGRDAFLSRVSVQLVGTFSLSIGDVEGDLLIARTESPARLYSEITVPGIGSIRAGYDGEVGWAIDPIMGVRILEGGELERLRDIFSLSATVRSPENFRSMETVERTDLGGGDCWKVRLIWAKGDRESFDCYAVDTGLIVATIATQSTLLGELEVVTLFSGYREFDGVLLATRMVQRPPESDGPEQVVEVLDVEFDVVEEERFELPEEVRALIGISSPEIEGR